MGRDVSCRLASFREEAEAICGHNKLGKFRRELERNGWEQLSGRGKGGHSQYAKDGINDKIVLPSGKDSDTVPGYLKKQITELYARAFPDQFPADLVERALTRVNGKAEDYCVAAANRPTVGGMHI